MTLLTLLTLMTLLTLLTLLRAEGSRNGDEGLVHDSLAPYSTTPILV
jgi:hypothetical protein